MHFYRFSKRLGMHFWFTWLPLRQSFSSQYTALYMQHAYPLDWDLLTAFYRMCRECMINLVVAPFLSKTLARTIAACLIVRIRMSLGENMMIAYQLVL
jgi:hypothetical protein